jgi:hypothetical protein
MTKAHLSVRRIGNDKRCNGYSGNGEFNNYFLPTRKKRFG